MAGDLSTEPLAVAQAFVRGYLKYGVEAARRCEHLFAPDVVLVIHTAAAELPFAGKFRGVDGIDRMLRESLAQFVSVREDFGKWFTDGPRVAALRHQVMRPAAGGEPFEAWILHEYMVSGGRLARIDNYIDAMAYSRGLAWAGAVSDSQAGPLACPLGPSRP